MSLICCTRLVSGIVNLLLEWLRWTIHWNFDGSRPSGHQMHTVKSQNKVQTNLVKIFRIEGYNGKYGSNPQGIRKISDDLFEFDQILRWIDDRNWGERYIMKENFNMIPRNKKSSNLTLISCRNWTSKWGDCSKIEKRKNNKNWDKINLKLLI